MLSASSAVPILYIAIFRIILHTCRCCCRRTITDVKSERVALLCTVFVVVLTSFTCIEATCAQYAYVHRVPKKLVHQAHIDNLVNSQRIFKILSLAQSAENLL